MKAFFWKTNFFPLNRKKRFRKSMQNYFISVFFCFACFDKIGFLKFKSGSKQNKGSVFAQIFHNCNKNVYKTKILYHWDGVGDDYRGAYNL